MARKIMVEDPVHPKYQDPSTPFDVWLDYMEENHPEYDAIHFYETEELVMSDKAFADSLSDSDVVALEADYGKDSNLWTPEVESRWYQAIDKPVESSLWGGLDDTVLDSLENAGVPPALLIALSAAVGNKKGTAKRTKKMLTNSSKKTDDVVKANQSSWIKAKQAQTKANADNKAKVAQKKADNKTNADKDKASAEGRAAEKHPDPAKPAKETTQKRDLTGDRDKDGSLIPLSLKERLLTKAGLAGAGTGIGLGLIGANELVNTALTEEDFTKEAEAPKVKQSKSPEGTVYPGENKESMITGKQIAKPSTEEKPGWQQNPGDNWWSVNTESPYWQTQEGAKEAFELYGKKPAWAASVDKEEFDFVEFKDLLGLK